MQVEPSSPAIYHEDFNDPQANIIIKSEDGMSFKIHDFYLKANRCV